VDTPLTDHTLERIGERTKRTRAESLETLLAHAGQPRLVTADEVATTVLSLCGEAAATITGQAIVLDAGALRV
jgi:NAD(P)-dependent dehydrogenase (short-subunit alcohol dehydrogenase family)